jgi:hypothetical protein
VIVAGYERQYYFLMALKVGLHAPFRNILICVDSDELVSSAYITLLMVHFADERILIHVSF